jgi:hypothetical protein
MQELIALLQNPVVWKVLIGYWAFSALVGALPSPTEVLAVKPTLDPIKLLVYKFFFSALHGLSGNLSRAAVAFKVPGAKDDSQA